MIPVKIQRVGLRIRGGIEIGLLDLHGETSGNKAVLFVVPSGAYGSERRGPDLLLPAPHPPALITAELSVSPKLSLS